MRGGILVAIVIVFAAFVGGFAAGFIRLKPMELSAEQPVLAEKIQPAVGEDISKPFARHFQDIKVMTEKRAAPDTTFLNPDGKEASLADFSGKYILLNLWATWCGPCVLELPSLEKFRDSYAAENIEVLAVSIDYNKDQDSLRRFLENRGIGEFALNYDINGSVQQAFPAPGIPTTFLISPDGDILYIFEGDADWMVPESLAFFNALLTEN